VVAAAAVAAVAAAAAAAAAKETAATPAVVVAAEAAAALAASGVVLAGEFVAGEAAPSGCGGSPQLREARGSQQSPHRPWAQCQRRRCCGCLARAGHRIAAPQARQAGQAPWGMKQLHCLATS
jgi:hypothetical protein